jgi:hypothetical protein
MYKLLIAALIAFTSGCATLTNDAMTPVTVTFSDGSNGDCSLTNKRGAWTVKIPGTIQVRRSDDGLRYDAKTTDGRTAVGVIPSKMGAKIIASAVFIDFGIVDAITDKHRDYPPSFVIPMARVELPAVPPDPPPQPPKP